MFNKYTFRKFWEEELESLCLQVLTVDESKLKWEPFKKSDMTFFLGGLKLGDKTCHLTITPDKNGDFKYFHFTLDSPEVKYMNNAQVRCDHVFFEISDLTGDIEVTNKLLDGNGKHTTADSKGGGLTNNAQFLVNKVKTDLEKIMSCYSAHYIGEAAGWKVVDPAV